MKSRVTTVLPLRLCPLVMEVRDYTAFRSLVGTVGTPPTQPQKGLNMKLQHQVNKGSIRVRAVEGKDAGPWTVVASGVAPRAVHVRRDDEHGKAEVEYHTRQGQGVQKVVRQLTVKKKAVFVGRERPAAK